MGRRDELTFGDLHESAPNTPQERHEQGKEQPLGKFHPTVTFARPLFKMSMEQEMTPLLLSCREIRVVGGERSLSLAIISLSGRFMTSKFFTVKECEKGTSLGSAKIETWNQDRTEEK